MLSHQLKVFLQVAKSGSFTKAAEVLYTTPASVMKHINTLEYRLNLKLLSRTKHGVSLTSAGKIIFEEALKFVEEEKKIIARAKDSEFSGTTIRIGSSLLNPSKTLTDLWNSACKKNSSFQKRYRFNIVPFADDRENTLSLVASLGEKIDLLVGAFNSKKMQETADYYPLGTYALCVAVPKNHRLCDKSWLSVRDLYGEHLVMVKSGDTELLDNFREAMKMTHPQILIEGDSHYYDIETFNECERLKSILLTLDAWKNIHPSLVTLPVNWNYRVPYGILCSKDVE